MFLKKDKYIHLIIKVKDSSIFAYFGDKDRIGISKKGTNDMVFHSDEIQSILESIKVFHKQDEELNINKVKQDTLSPYLIKVTSSEYEHHKITPTQINYRGKIFIFDRGINVFYEEDGYNIIKTFDTHKSAEDAKNW